MTFQNSHHNHSCAVSQQISEIEIAQMARVISSRYGAHAWSVANGFMQQHQEISDELRAAAWGRVAQYLFENTTVS